MKLTKLQEVVRTHIQRDESVLLIAPTGIGKTLAVLSHLTETKGRRVVFGLPLRALAGTISEEASGLKRNGRNIRSAIHHGDIQDSWLFSEEVVVTTYDQVVCAVPGLPLSLPASAGHAVAGALLMSTLVLDEVHLAWSISREALTILLAIIEFRQKFGLQTVVMTATMPLSVGRTIADRLGLTLIVAGEGATEEDEGLKLRQQNRKVQIGRREIKDKRNDKDQPDVSEVAQLLYGASSKRIYFANTVRRLQVVYDGLRGLGVEDDRITVLHNQMPRAWREEAEREARRRFDRQDLEGDWLLLTNQVAEAGLDISAPLVLSDPAPVDTLIQRAGRCSRWFRNSETSGKFEIVKPPPAKLKDWAIPYPEKSVKLAMDKLGNLMEAGNALDWDFEKRWIDAAWLGREKASERDREIEEHLDRTAFAINLFDRASQQRSPGAIAGAFREILSVQVAVLDEASGIEEKNLLAELKKGSELESCPLSLRTAYALLRKGKGKARVVRQGDELAIEREPIHITVGDLLIVPPSIAYLHSRKGLCIRGDDAKTDDATLTSRLLPTRTKDKTEQAKRTNPQSLWSHTKGVMNGVEGRLKNRRDYRVTLLKILEHLEGRQRAEDMVDALANMAILATGFHDIGKCGERWQKRAHEIDPASTEELIGRTRNTSERIGVPHTPPAFNAAVAALKAAVGDAPELDQLIRAVSLAAARHHSSMLDPSGTTSYDFDPIDGLGQRFVEQVLSHMGLSIPPERILQAACARPAPEQVPLILPNDDLFPIYALLGRAILISDREDAAGEPLED